MLISSYVTAATLFNFCLQTCRVNFSSQFTLTNIKLNKIMPPFEKPPPQKPFKQRKTFATRKLEVAGIRSKFPTKIPVIIERYQREKFLPPLDKTKFLVPQELSMTQFVTIIRNRMCLMPSQAFYLLINNSGLPSMSLTMAQVYKDHKDDDGFLYMTYASQEMFGDSVEC